MTTKLAKKDLSTFSESDLNTLFSYYNIPEALPKKQKINSLIHHLYSKRVKTTKAYSPIGSVKKYSYKKGTLAPGDIFEMIEQDNLNQVKEIVNIPGFNINMLNANGETPLYSAVAWNRLPIARYLIEHGADVNIISAQGQNVLMSYLILFRRNIDNDFAKLLIDKTTNLDYIANNKTALLIAINNGYIEIVKYLLEKGVNVNQNINNVYPLLELIENIVNYAEYIDIAINMINNGADVNISNAVGFTTLMLLIRAYGYRPDDSNMVKLIQVSVDKTSDTNINAKNHNGGTALMLAARFTPVNIIKMLIDHGANINLKDNGGNTALVYAIKESDIETVQFLLDNGADVNNSLVLDAANKSEPTLISLLIDHGAPISANNIEALHIKARDYRLQIQTLRKFLNKDEQTLFDTSKTGKACSDQKNITIESLKTLEECIKMLTEMIKYGSKSKGLKKLEEKYKDHPYFQESD